jgi:decaprenyl-phosphate phosphoribosyltransferase
VRGSTITKVSQSSPSEGTVRRSFTDAFLRALRPKQWVKNLLVFAAPGAAGVLGRPDVLARSAAAFAAFSMVAGATYLVNDIADAASDREHPTKRLRPIAAGELSSRAATIGAAALFVAGLVVSSLLGLRFLAVVAAYIAVTVVYSLWLKRVAVIEMGVVASGFVLRAVAGSAATHVPPSAWFLILASSGAMFVVAGKRLADVRSGAPPRPRYPAEFLRGAWMLSAGVTVTAYCLWAFAVPHTVDGIAWSQVSIVPFALAILRYAYGIEMGEGGSPETVFLRDRALEMLTVAWAVVYALGVYLK